MSLFANIQDYGAIGDGNIANAAVNAQALRDAIATNRIVWVPYTAAGYHFGTQQIDVGSGVTICGENEVLLKWTGGAGAIFFSITTYEHESSIGGFTIDGTGADVEGTIFRFRTATNVVYRVRFNDMYFKNCPRVFDDEVSTSNYIVDARFTNLKFLNQRNQPIRSRRSRGFYYFENIQHDHTVNTGAITWIDGDFNDAIGLEINRWDCSGGNSINTYTASQYGLRITNSISVWLYRVEVDSTAGNGMLFSSVRFLRMDTCSSFGNLGNGIYLALCTESAVSNINVTGGYGFTGDAGGAGLTLDTCTNCAVSNLLSANCSASALIVNNSTSCSITNFLGYSNHAYAYALIGTSGHIILNGGSLNSNSNTCLLSATGIGNAINNLIGYNPIGAAVVTTGGSPWTYQGGLSPETLYIAAGGGAGSITQVTQGGVSILPQATANNASLSIQLGPNESVVVTYVGPLVAKKMVH